MPSRASHGRPMTSSPTGRPFGVVAGEQAAGGVAAYRSASFQARLWASWIPVFMPCPPVGG